MSQFEGIIARHEMALMIDAIEEISKQMGDHNLNGLMDQIQVQFHIRQLEAVLNDLKNFEVTNFKGSFKDRMI